MESSTNPAFGRPLKEKIARKIKDFTLRQTQFYDVSEGTDLLNPLNVPVLPQLAELTVDIANNHVTFNIHKEQNKNKAGNQALEKLFEDFDKGRINFVGQAGSGKTTLLKLIARDVTEKKIPSLKEVDLVFFLNCQNLQPEKNITLENLIFENMGLEKKEKDKTLQFIKEHPENFLFVVDAPDNLDYDMDGCCDPIGDKEITKPARVLWNLIQGKSFSRCRVITSERGVGVDVRGVQPKKIVALAGLDPNSMKEIAIGYLGNEEGNKMMDYLRTKSPSLMSVCSIPVFLTYTIMGMKSDDNFKPSTMSGVMINLLQSFIRSKHAMHEDIENILHKLKELSFNGVENNKVLFTAQDMNQYDLTFKDAGDFTTLKGLVQSMKDQQLIHFNHFSIQMTLAAMFIAELPIDDFKKFVINTFNELRYAAIQRNVFGLLLDDEVANASKTLLRVECNLREKQAFLRQIVSKRIKSTNGCVTELSLLASIHEAKDGMRDMVKDQVHSIKVEDIGHPLSPNDAYVIGSIAQHCTKLEELSVSATDLQPYPLSVLKDCLLSSPVSISKFCLSHNPNLRNGIVQAGQIISNCNMKEVEMRGCYFTCQEIDSFQSSLHGYKVERIDLTVREVIGSSEMKRADECRLVDAHWILSPGNLSSDDLTVDQLNDVKKKMMGPTKLEIKINVQGTWKQVTDADYRVVVNLLLHCVRKKLTLYGWNFDPHLRKTLEKMMEYLPLGRDVALTEDDVLHTKGDLELSMKSVQYCDFPGTRNLLQLGQNVDWNELRQFEWWEVLLICDGNFVGRRRMDKENPFMVRTSKPSKKFSVIIVGIQEVMRGTVKENSKRALNVKWNLAESETINLVIRPHQDYVLFCGTKDSQLVATLKLSELIVQGHKLNAGNAVDVRSKTESAKIIKYIKPVQTSETDLVRLVNDFGKCGEDIAKKRSTSEYPTGEIESFGLCVEHEETSALLDEVNSPQDLIKRCQERKSRIQWNEIQIAHTIVTNDMIEFISNVITSSSCVDEFCLRESGINVEVLTTLHSLFNEIFCNIKEFSVGCEENISILLPTLCKVLRTCNTKIFNIAENEISAETLHILQQSLTDNPIKSLSGLDLSYNTGIQDFTSLAKILNMFPINELRMMNCNLEEGNLQTLHKSTGKGKLKRLNLSYNPEMTPYCYEIAASLLQHGKLDFLGFSECEMTDDEIHALRKSLAPGTSLRKLDISYNENLEFSDRSELTLMIKGLNITELSIAGCDLIEEQVKSMCIALHGHQLTKLDVSDNMAIRNGVTHIATMIRTCPVKNLDMSECMLNAKHLKRFVNELGSSQLTTLNLSDIKRSVDTDYVKVVCKVIPCIKKELILCYGSMADGCWDLLQEALDREDNKDLRITYGFNSDGIRSFKDVRFTAACSMRRCLVTNTNVK